MNNRILPVVALVLITACSQPGKVTDEHPLQNRYPLTPKKYMELPLGTIHPDGWLLQQLELMRDGMTGHLGVRGRVGDTLSRESVVAATRDQQERKNAERAQAEGTRTGE